MRIIFALLFALTLSAPAFAADIQKSLTVVFGHEGGLQCDYSDPGN